MDVIGATIVRTGFVSPSFHALKSQFVTGVAVSTTSSPAKQPTGRLTIPPFQGLADIHTETNGLVKTAVIERLWLMASSSGLLVMEAGGTSPDHWTKCQLLFAVAPSEMGVPSGYQPDSEPDTVPPDPA